ncbi:hypothetical protein KAR91_33770 [Candidatus Pacearchaeota archaeon]|nr:hypothetical protein [Candidatus Pacearchaeota archaeon]
MGNTCYKKDCSDYNEHNMNNCSTKAFVAKCVNAQLAPMKQATSVPLDKIVSCRDLGEAIEAKKDSIAFLTKDGKTCELDCVKYDSYNDALLIHVKAVKS